MQLTPEQQRILDDKRQQISQTTAASVKPEVEPQRARMAAQGLTFGFADEIEAAIQSAMSGDKTYEQALQEIRGKIAAYKKDSPYAAMGFEALGALPTAFVGGAPATLARMAGRAGAEGALYAAGTEDGSVGERIAAMPGGAVGGAIGGAIGGGVGSALGASATGITEFARRKLGDKGASVVSREVQRLVELTGKTPDEVLADVAEGRIMAENKTLQNVARAYYTSNTPAKPVIEQGMRGRPLETRGQAVDVAQEGLTPGIVGEDVSVQGRNIMEAERKAAGAQYAPGKTQPVGDELRVQLADTLERIPSAADEIKRSLDLELKGADFYQVAKRDDGSSYIIFNREPTVAEAEVIRRTINNVKDKAFKEGSGEFGTGVGTVESDLRSVIDRISPETADAREAYKIAMGNKDAFTAGTKAMTGDTFETIDMIRNMTPDQRAAFKVGFMSYLRNTSTKGTSGARVARDMANPEGAMQRILFELLPEDQARMVIDKFDVAKGAQEASNYVLSGSGTAGTEMARKGIGRGTDMADAIIRGIQGDPTGAIVQVKRLVAENTESALNDKQMAEVAEYLVTTNPDFLAKALKDEGMFADLQRYIEKLGTIVAQGGRLTGAQQTGGYVGGETSPLMIHVTKGMAED
jgi:hypothetical protein